MVEIPYTPDDAESIRLLFTRIARNYDRTNRVISLGLDVRWRRKFARLFDGRNRIADICCGSGAMFPILGERLAVGVDFTHEMLRVASRFPGYRLVEGDAQKIPLQTGSFDGAIIVYSIRNIPDVEKALRELFRVLKPGGLLGILDFGVPKGPILRFFYLLYFKTIIPFVGSWIAKDRSSYHYFVRSVMNFPKRESFLELMERAGFHHCRWEEYMMGAALGYIAEKPEPA